MCVEALQPAGTASQGRRTQDARGGQGAPLSGGDDDWTAAQLWHPGARVPFGAQGAFGVHRFGGLPPPFPNSAQNITHLSAYLSYPHLPAPK